jgi:ATP-dependent helicase/nuclease subunit A
MTTAIDTANAEQRAASDPKSSAFVAASAGSGKTKLLTDRLLRLMLAGTPPQKILCLTYTKAAAAEMAIRLTRRLGAWVAMPDETLNAELRALGVPIAARDTARKLFADVLDLPGGMRIFTIHAFCQSVLRRFPLEANLSPHFTLEDETQAAARLRESRESILAQGGHRDAISSLAAESSETDFARLITRLAGGEHGAEALFTQNSQAALEAMQTAALAAGDHDHETLVRNAIAWERETHVQRAWQRLAEAGNPSGRVRALAALEWLAHDAETRFAKWVDWLEHFITGAGTPRVMKTFYGKALAAEQPALQQEFDAEHGRIAAIEEARRAARLAALNKALAAIARPILAHDAAQKTGHAAVSYADLIARTVHLLRNPEDVAWILYKLDGGIDHLLLDEVQDTAPAQWDITNAIAAEFFSGRGARDATRTIFAVGDPKQSIFSFQGADLDSFDTNRDTFRALTRDAGQAWLDGKLSVSFRSTEPVLKLVDAVFRDGFACDGVTPPNAFHHVLSRQGQAGAITLLPLTKAEDASPLPPWSVPDSYESAVSAKTSLARLIASTIRDALDDGKFLPSRNAPATPGDFLVLVRHRDEFLPALTRAAKELSIPIAGADRIILTESQAVADLLALCDALLLPEDDLAFAHFLASPLGGLSDDSLAALAIGRPQSLAAALFARRAERPEWQAASDFFAGLAAQTDFLSPHALLSQILHPLGGRARLLARLGPDAAEPIDEILAEALGHGASGPASLQIFLQDLRQSTASLKREAEAAGDVVRIMTVHGAKGLQAPIVILPDTTSLPKQDENLYWLDVPQQAAKVPVYCPRKELRSEAVAKAVEAARTAGLHEYNRLLYVALTRAEDEILIAGAEGAKKIPENCWYKAIEAGFDRLGVSADEFGIRALATTQTATPDREAAHKSALAAGQIPSWAGAAPLWHAAPPAAETTRPEPLAPSRSADDQASAATAASPLSAAGAPLREARAAARAKGLAVHTLLQHLPDLPPAARRDAALKYLANPAIGLKNQAAIVESVLAILENPGLAPLFGPGSRAEVPLAGVVAHVEIGGLIDRLAVTDQKIIIADYKTNRVPPTRPEDIPASYLAQLAAYAAILAQIHPDLPIECLLIWTETAAIMPVPAVLLARHAPRPAQPSAA